MVKTFKVPRTLIGCGLVVVLVLVCIGGAVFAVDRVCYASLSQRLPIYPNAGIVSRVHNFLTEFGMGNTVFVLYSPDDPATVRAWYAQQTSDYLERAMAGGDLGFRMAQAEWSADRAEDGSGTQIILFGTCAN